MNEVDSQLGQAIITGLLLVVAYFVRQALSKLEELDGHVIKIKERLVRIETTLELELELDRDTPS